MGLWSSMYTGMSGMAANSIDLGVIGDNIANVNTIGFKAGRAAFEDALAQNMIGGANSQRGWGTKLQAIQKLMTQGSLANTGLATDLAIQGSGFFMVRGNHNGMDGSFYTRSGQFTVDENGMLVNLSGLQVQGYAADANGAITGALGGLRVGDAQAAPRPSSNLTVRGNLQADAAIPAAFNAANAAGTSNFSTTITVYDSLGKAIQTDVYFRRNGAGTWEWHALTDGGNVAGGTAGTPSEIASGTLTYDTQGRLTAETQTSNFNPLGAVNPQPLTFNFGDPTGAGGTGLGGLTQFSSPSATTFQSQDGYAAGDLARVTIDAQGVVTGIFSNGQSRALGQLAIANFEAPDQLERLGGNLFGQMPQSGDPVVGVAASGGRGSVASGALEQSNVDLATEFVRMIAAQRAFQANSKTITTADQLLQELINIKR